jgi:hypothetical protein
VAGHRDLYNRGYDGEILEVVGSGVGVVCVVGRDAVNVQVYAKPAVREDGVGEEVVARGEARGN